MAATLSSIRVEMQSDASGIVGGGYTLNAARCVLGYDDLSFTTEFLQTLGGFGSATSGPYLVIKPGDLTDFDIQTQRATYEIPCDLWLGITRETDNNFTAIEDFLEALKTAWKGRSSKWELERPMDVKKNPIPVHYTFNVTSLGC